jgi:hypothetical protein
MYNKCTVHYIQELSYKDSQGGIAQIQSGDCLNQVHSDQRVLGIVRWEAGPCERQPKTLKTKLIQGVYQA